MRGKPFIEAKSVKFAGLLCTGLPGPRARVPEGAGSRGVHPNVSHTLQQLTDPLPMVAQVH